MKDHSEIEDLFTGAAKLATQFLRESQDSQTPVLESIPPEDLIETLGVELPEEGRGASSALDLARATLRFSVRTAHPRFMNQLFGGCDPAGILGEWIAAVSNTSMYTYEAAPVGTVVELALIERLNSYVGFSDGEGVFTPGGSISNLMSVLAARHRAFPHLKREGLRSDEQPVLFVSAESHYSLKRAAIVAGLGAQAAVPVPVDEVGRMRPDELERLIRKERARGRTPFYVAATAGTTVAGAFDPIEPIADVAERHGLWLHIDGSYGGSVLLSDRLRHLLAGSERADSMAWNPHKLMGVPLSSSALLVKRAGALASTLEVDADYLFHEDSDETWELGSRSLQCGRRVDALKLWFSWQSLGTAGFRRRVEQLFDQAELFRELIREREGFRLIREQEGPNVCFRYLPQEYRDATGEDREQLEQLATTEIRAALVREGSFLINYATVDGVATFRMVASNPETGREDLVALLEAIEEVPCCLTVDA